MQMLYNIKQMEVTKKNIHGTDFYIKPFPAFTAANISGELSAILVPVLASIAPMFGNVVQGGQDEGKTPEEMVQDIMDQDIDQYLPQIASALSSLNGNKVESMMRKLLVDYSNISYDDEKGQTTRLTYEDANEVFCGRIFDMYRLCYEVIKVNFGGFFDSLSIPYGDVLTRFGMNATPKDSAN